MYRKRNPVPLERLGTLYGTVFPIALMEQRSKQHKRNGILYLNLREATVNQSGRFPDFTGFSILRASLRVLSLKVGDGGGGV